MDGSGDYIQINHDLCIGCGSCIDVCSHQAREILDDFESFLNEVGKKPMVAVVAPSAAVSFGEDLLRFNTYLKSIGVEAIFDVSFGAELTIKTYIEHIKATNPDLTIAQPCPAIVNYIELYQPQLLPYLAPADSPMLHALKLIRKHYPRFSNHKVVVISPCIAKKREFQETGLGDFNVTLSQLEAYLKGADIDLATLEETAFDGPMPERGVLFSSPGGLKETLS